MSLRLYSLSLQTVFLLLFRLSDLSCSTLTDNLLSFLHSAVEPIQKFLVTIFFTSKISSCSLSYLLFIF